MSSTDDHSRIEVTVPDEQYDNAIAPDGSTASTTEIHASPFVEIRNILESNFSDDQKVSQITGIVLNAPLLQEKFAECGWNNDLHKFDPLLDFERMSIIIDGFRPNPPSSRKIRMCRECNVPSKGHTCRLTEEAKRKAAATREAKKELAMMKDDVIQATREIVLQDSGIMIKVPVGIYNSDKVFGLDDNSANPKTSDEINHDVIERIERIEQCLPEVFNEVDTLQRELDNLSIFDIPTKLSCVSWNAHYLSAMDNSEVTQQQWDQIYEEFAKHDIITMTEILPTDSEHKDRLKTFIANMNKVSGFKWQHRVSKPSGPGDKKNVHVIMVRPEPEFKIVKYTTIKPMRNSVIDYRPLVVHIKVNSMAYDKFEGDFVISSIHMPPPCPIERRILRDTQIQSWINCYKCFSHYRLDRTMGEQSARDAKQAPTIHIMQGDWNKWMGDYDSDARDGGFKVMLPNNVSTTGGKKCYDNFLVSNNYDKYLNVPTKQVLRFRNFLNTHRRENGLSDHAPINIKFEVLR
jgi:hypothetical protein